MGAIGDLVSLAALCGVGYIALTWNSGTGDAIKTGLKTFVADTTGHTPQGQSDLPGKTTRQIWEELYGGEIPDNVGGILEGLTNAANDVKDPAGTITETVTNAYNNLDDAGKEQFHQVINGIAAGFSPAKTTEILAAAGSKTADGIARAVDSIANGTWEWTGFKAPWDW